MKLQHSATCTTGASSPPCMLPPPPYQTHIILRRPASIIPPLASHQHMKGREILVAHAFVSECAQTSIAPMLQQHRNQLLLHSLDVSPLHHENVHQSRRRNPPSQQFIQPRCCLPWHCPFVKGEDLFGGMILVMRDRMMMHTS
jgi:hypothetical protein